MPNKNKIYVHEKNWTGNGVKYIYYEDYHYYMDRYSKYYKKWLYNVECVQLSKYNFKKDEFIETVFVSVKFLKTFFKEYNAYNKEKSIYDEVKK